MKTKRKPPFFLIVSLCIFMYLGLSTKAEALPVSSFFVPATTEGETAVGSQYQHIDFVRSTDQPIGVTLNPRATLDVFAMFGIRAWTKDIQSFLFVPWIRNNFKINLPLPPPPFGPGGFVEARSNTSGWGDPALSTIFRLSEWQGRGWYISVPVIIGVQFPIGDWNQKSSSGEFVPRLAQPGKGNWSAFTTFVCSAFTANHDATLTLTYQPYFRGHGFRHGQQVVYQASVGHKFLPWKMKSRKAYWSYVYFNLEFIGIYTSKTSGNTHGRPPGFDFVPWSHWGRIIGSINITFPKIYSAFGVAYHQTAFWKTGSIAPLFPGAPRGHGQILRPQRVYQVTWETLW